MMWIGFIIFIVIFLALIGLYHLLFSLFFGAPFQSTRKKKMETILNFIKPRKKDNILECGSGNLCVAIKFAKKDAKVVAYEINFILYIYSKYFILKKGLKKYLSIKLGNFFNANFKGYNKIYLFGFPNMIDKFSKKASKECEKGTIIVSNYWKLKESKNLKFVKEKDRVYLYKIN